MILKILTGKSKILKTVCTEIKEITPAIRKLARNMVDTMNANQGAGLAANQVGHTVRLIIVRNTVMINPVIMKSRGNVPSFEGCLSIPNKQVTKQRADDILVKWTDLDGNKQLEGIAGFEAFIIQHEIDHLNGILMTDKE